MSTTIRPIFGREAELLAVEEFLDGLPAGMAALRLEGDPGIGKTTLWEAAVDRAAARGVRVLATRTSQAEARLSFTGLTDLLGGVEGRVLTRLPPPQRHALDVALLRAEPGADGPDQRAIAMGTLSLVRALVAEGPLLLAVDDAQWLDGATADVLAFAARRLGPEPAGLAVSVRTAAAPVATFDDAVPGDRRRRVRVGPLSLAGLHRLIRAELDLVLPRPVLVRIETASGGNPFYALEIARELAAAGDLSVAAVPVPEDLRSLLGARIRRLPEETRDALLLAAALTRPTTALVPQTALAAAEEAEVVRLEPGGSIRFTHPLLASTVYERASDEQRREVHGRLADRVAEPEERARHLALAAAEPDEAVAAALDDAADAAWARGALQAAADLLELSLRLTPADLQTEVLPRRLRFAESLLRVGDSERARAELDALFGLGPSGDLRGEALLASAKLGWLGDSQRGIAILEGALEEAVEPLLRARIHARLSWLLMDIDVAAAAAHAHAGLALAGVDDDAGVHAYLLLQRVWCDIVAGGPDDPEAYDRGVALLRRVSPWEQSPVPLLHPRQRDDLAAVGRQAGETLAYAREQGDVAAVAHSLATLAGVATWTGDPIRGLELATEARELVEVSDVHIPRVYVGLALGGALCVLGRDEEARQVLEGRLAELRGTSNPGPEGAVRALLGLLELSLGDVAAAERQLARAAEIQTGMGHREPIPRMHADLAEAVLLMGDLARAEDLVGELEARAVRFPRPWTRCVSRRCRGLLVAAQGDLGAAAAILDDALARHAELAMPFELGRTLIAAGQVARRARQWGPARAHLDRAREIFAGMDARLWTGIADAEMGRIAGRPPADRDGLTVTEQRVAELATDGLTNRQIADALFLSPKTVETHLTRIYRKLGLRSRAALAARITETQGRDAQT